MENIQGVHLLASKIPEADALLSIVANPRRLLILCHLINDGELPVGEIGRRIDLAQSPLSQHLALMREAGAVSTRREGTTIYYSIADKRIHALLKSLNVILAD